MSKNSTRTTSKTNLRNEAQPRKTTKSPATSEATTTRSTKLRVKQQDSAESEASVKKTTKTATSTSKTTATRTASSNKNLHISKNKDSKRTTPSPTTKTKQVAVSKAKPNAVLDTYHSVTVSSPPTKRKVQQSKHATAAVVVPRPIDGAEEQQQERAGQLRARTLSRTLQPEEIVVLKRESAKLRSELEVQQQVKEIQQPVSFEVKFETPKKTAAVESDNYSDDFESYESDFETDTSTPEEEEEEEQVDEAEISLKSEEPALIVEDEEEEDSEPTQNPITVIQRDKDVERKLDSGHYDMNSTRRQPRQHFDSFDTNSMANSEQLDSGISSYGNAVVIEPTKSSSDVHYGGYVDFIAHPVITRRGEELMRKLRFDHLDYQLFEMKPLSYEGYMQSYGKLNTTQTTTQTIAQQLDMECQTLELHTRTCWTQQPPHYAAGQLVLNCSGEASNESMSQAVPAKNDAVEFSLARLEQLRLVEQKRALEQQRQRLTKPNDLERLEAFLHKASLLLGKVLSCNAANTKARQMALLQTGRLDALQVRRIFGSTGKLQLVVTVHECSPANDVYRDDFANLLMVWSLTDPSKPLRLLSTWAEVCRVCFCSAAPDIIVAGLRDGSVAMWDLRETHSYCSKLDGNLTHFAATQSVVPSLDSNQQQDLGAVVDVRSFRAAAKTAGMGLGSSLINTHKDIQYASLNDSGLLAIWSLVASGATSSNEYCSPWARVKLLQAASCDLRGYLERRLLKSKQTGYEKTKSLFQGNVYSDELLRELNETQTLTSVLADQGLQGLRFSGIDAGSELVYVCSNRNFVLCCTRSLKTERFTRIALHESRFLFPTALCVLANEHFVAVGLSNGSVMILNCNQRQRQRLIRPTTAMPQPEQIAPDPDIGKSCAIQNIILNERRFDQEDLECSNYDARPNTALQLIQQPRRSYELRAFDQELLLSGSSMRQHLVQALVQSTDGWKLFALSNGTVRSYDFHLDREVPEIGSNITDIAAACGSMTAQQLLTLESGGQVQMHSLNL